MKQSRVLLITIFIFCFLLMLPANTEFVNNNPAFSPGQAKIKITGTVIYNKTVGELKASLTATYKGKAVLGAIIKVDGFSLTDEGDGFYTMERSNYKLLNKKKIRITMNYHYRRDKMSPIGEITLAEYTINLSLKHGEKAKFILSKDTAIGSEIFFKIIKSPVK